jgi:hypothetical protein
VPISDEESIDSAGIDERTGDVVLTIADDLDWRDERAHFLTLERKINAYLGFIESGRLLESLPLAAGKRVRIAVYQRLDPPFNAVGVLEALGRFLRERGVEFTYGVAPG